MSEKLIEKYIWKSSGDGCEKCEALDGTEYKKAEDIPDKPHPNCQCSIEEVPVEMCDRHDEELDELDDLIGNGESLQNEIEDETSNVESLEQECGENDQDIISRIHSLIDDLSTLAGVVGDFISNFVDLLLSNTKKADDYYHKKANCQAAQRGELGAEIAEGIRTYPRKNRHSF